MLLGNCPVIISERFFTVYWYVSISYGFLVHFFYELVVSILSRFVFFQFLQSFLLDLKSSMFLC